MYTAQKKSKTSLSVVFRACFCSKSPNFRLHAFSSRCRPVNTCKSRGAVRSFVVSGTNNSAPCAILLPVAAILPQAVIISDYTARRYKKAGQRPALKFAIPLPRTHIQAISLLHAVIRAIPLPRTPIRAISLRGSGPLRCPRAHPG